MDADYCASAAFKNIAEARRYLEEKSWVGSFCDLIYTGIMWAIQAWLISRGIEPDARKGWQSMRFQFHQVAPRDLAAKASTCLAGVLMHQGPIGRFEGDEFVYRSPSYISEEWQRVAMKYLLEAEEILDLLLSRE